ncbi:hypothetical protein [Streptomyces sp. NPDC001348]
MRNRLFRSVLVAGLSAVAALGVLSGVSGAKSGVQAITEWPSAGKTQVQAITEWPSVAVNTGAAAGGAGS